MPSALRARAPKKADAGRPRNRTLRGTARLRRMPDLPITHYRTQSHARAAPTCQGARTQRGPTQSWLSSAAPGGGRGRARRHH
jgi:hypothetical protein